MNATLYEKDYCLWLEAMSQLLQDGKLAELDRENLLEEIQAMARSEKRALVSNLRVLLMHLLKWKYQPEKRSNSWKFTIREHRLRLQDHFRDSPSLKPYFSEVFDESYEIARKLAADETGLSLNIFPINCPFSEKESLNFDYLPNHSGSPFAQW